MSGTDLQSRCASSCETARLLNCPNDDPAACASTCIQTLSLVAETCPEANDAYIACSLGRPVTDHECNAEGQAELAPGVCESERAAWITCLTP